MSLEFTRQYVEGDRVAGRFEVIRVLGGGATGLVYLVRDSQLDGTEIALKLLHPHLNHDPGVISRLQNEPTVSRKICSPHLVQVFEFHSLESGEYLITMEYLEGVSLRTLIDSAPTGLPLGEVLSLLRKITTAIDAMHRAGFLHRDLKPENILITANGEVKLVDFGLAAPITENKAGAALCIGTPYYTSPELVRGEAIDHRSDYYSLGIIAFELCAGSRPFQGKSEAELLDKHVRAALPELPASVSNWFSALVSGLCAKQPRRRPPDAETILQQLDYCQTAEQSLLYRTVASRQTGRLLQVSTCVLVLFSLLILVIRQSRETALYASVPILFLEKVTGADLSTVSHFIGADVSYSRSSFIDVISRSDGNGLRILAALGMDLNAPIPALRRFGSDLPIFFLVWRGGSLLRDYVALGARTDVRNAKGQTPLMLAAQTSRGDTVPLLANESTLELRDDDGYTALCYAFKSKADFAIFYLLKLGAQSDVRLPDGTPCAHLLLRSFSPKRTTPELFMSIVTAGFPLELEDSATGARAVHMLAVRDDGRVLARLFDAGLLHDGKDRNGDTAIFYAAKAKNAGALEVLAQRSQSLDLVGAGDIPLGFIVLDGYREGVFGLDLFRKLIGHGLPVDRTLPHSQTTMLHRAAREGMGELYRLLVQSGAADDAPDESGETPREALARYIEAHPQSVDSDPAEPD